MIDFIIGILFAVLCGMGVGGGGLLVIYLTMLCEVEQRSAQGANLWFFVIASVFALTYHIRKRNINYKLVLVIIMSGLAFSILGALCANLADQSLLRRLFGGMLIAAGVVTLVPKKKNKLKKLS